MSIAVAQPGKTRIGWIGTGVMGRWMCQHAITKGYAATVYNRSKDKLQPLLEAGAKAAALVAPPGNLHASPEYLRHLTAVVVERALAGAFA